MWIERFICCNYICMCPPLTTNIAGNWARLFAPAPTHRISVTEYLSLTVLISAKHRCENGKRLNVLVSLRRRASHVSIYYVASALGMCRAKSTAARNPSILQYHCHDTRCVGSTLAWVRKKLWLSFQSVPKIMISPMCRTIIRRVGR